MMSDPRFSDPEVLRQAPSLPDRFRTPVSSRVLRPLIAPGTELSLVRRPAKKGDLVCLAGAARLVWRRVLAVRGDECLLRAEVAPFDDGWHRGILGVVEGDPAFPKWNPALWCETLWALASLRSRARGILAKHDPAPFSTCLLAPADAGDFADLMRRCGGYLPEALPEIALGLFTPEGVLVGVTCAAPESDGWSPWIPLAVDPEWRGRGGGARLLRDLIAEARRRGLEKISCYPPARHRDSRRACLAAGFRWTGRWWRGGKDPFEAAERQLLEVEADVRIPS